MDFTYTFRGQGSQPLVEWLEERGLKQRYCGVVNVSNMRDMYGVFYDSGYHCAEETDWRETQSFIEFARQHFGMSDFDMTKSFIAKLKPIGYRGIFDEEKDGSQIRLSSIRE